ncbi:alpha/beta fold hydrolase [Halegenticoccus soli]|uniref:alpha/beta fold hydrolase n=1 Tax=Halegenticoccus soli TaxID=1985678 RepID=UPI000C6D5B31|nr:alpha/beta fold hydrolase [Halegenticoccus soli]
MSPTNPNPSPSSNPFSLQRQAWKRAAADAEKATLVPDRLRRMATVEIEETPHEVVHAENKLALRRYESDAAERRDVPVLYAYAFVNRPFIVDLEPDRSVIRRFLERGFDVYLIDWGYPSRLDAHVGLDDYVGRYLDNCVDAAREETGADGVHLVGYSTGAPLCAMYAALYPEKVATLGLQGPPLDYNVDGGVFRLKGIVERQDASRFRDALGNVPAPLLDLGFGLRKPVEYAVANPLRLWDRFDDEEYVEHFARRLLWSADGPDVTGEVYRQFVDELIRENALMENELTVSGRRVDLSNVDAPVLLIVGRDDQFVPAESSLPFLDAVASEDTEVIEFPTGHVGLSVSREAHEKWWPRVCEWFARRS